MYLRGVKMIRNIKIALRNILLRESTKGLYKKIRSTVIKGMVVLNDTQFTKLKIRLNTGINLDLKNPKMFIEKINWLKLNYRNPLQTEYTDKFKVRNHVSSHGYGHILPPLLGVYDSFDQMNLNELPKKVFLKTNHTSGVNQIVEKENTNIKKTKNKFDKALKDNYFKYSREWNYKNIEPKILVEEYLDMNEFVDYKFFVFNGNVEFFAIIKDINDEKGNQSLNSKFNLYNKDLSKSSIDVKRQTFEDSNMKFSVFISEMINLSEKLAEQFPFCRVDFLVSNKEFIFGEMTFHPNGGEMVLYPLKNESIYGEKIDLKSIPKIFVKSD